jgi:hypothetical protein
VVTAAWWLWASPAQPSAATTAKRCATNSCKVGWVSFNASTSSPSLATTCRAITAWQPVASIVATASTKAKTSRSAGMASISCDLSSTATWPSIRPYSGARALTTCSDPLPASQSCDRRRVLPSTATAAPGAARPGREPRAASHVQEAGRDGRRVRRGDEAAGGVV